MSGYFDKFSFQVPFQMYGVQLEEYAFSYQRSPHLSAKTESFICLLIRVVATGMPFCVRSIQRVFYSNKSVDQYRSRYTLPPVKRFSITIQPLQ